ncbi:hypothetical protein [Vibrio hepatarius]|uniref:hypothetical protein n=1 Tax=Vibrio hepatarius TaxID=171383 RepID=UPI00142E3FAB|nr:hypothetical protein [Vibrio hepatarius]NIY81946.1 hypothetical protein [Vibrio hepatarius]
MSAEVRAVMSGSIEFSALNRELVLPFDITRVSELTDVELQFYSAPSVMPLINSAQLTGGEDFRLYVNEHNVTASLIQELVISLDENTHDTLKMGYLKGAKAYISLGKAMNLPEDQLDSDWAFAQAYAEDDNWAAKLTKLGDRSIGWSGNLHCLNYLYRFMPIKPMSLQAIWKRHVNTFNINEPEEISSLPNLVLTFSEGGAPSFDIFDPTETLPSGRLVYQVESLHKNPLEPRLRQIASRLKTISRQMELQRVDYLTPIKTNTETAVHDIELGNEDSKKSLDRLTEAVKKIG